MDLPAANKPEPYAAIMVATDFSVTATAAFHWALRIARGHRAAIELVHVIDSALMANDPQGLKGRVESRLSVLEQTAREAGVPVASRHEVGKPWEVIVEARRDSGADLLVLGTRGQTRYSRLFLGSTVDRVIRTAEGPVLTVHPDDAGKEGTLETVLVATDFSEEASLVTRAVLRLVGALPGPVRLVLLHVCHPPIEHGIHGAITVAAAEFAETRNRARHHLELLAVPLRSGRLRVDAIVGEGYPASAIEHEARGQRADLIALGTRGHSGLTQFLLGSVAQRVLHHASCPVLTVRHPAPARPAEVAREPGVTAQPGPSSV